MKSILFSTKKFRETQHNYLASVACQVAVLEMYLEDKRIIQYKAEAMVDMLENHISVIRDMKVESIPREVRDVLKHASARAWAMAYRADRGFQGFTRKEAIY